MVAVPKAAVQQDLATFAVDFLRGRAPGGSRAADPRWEAEPADNYEAERTSDSEAHQ